MTSRIPVDLSIPKILSRNTTSADDNEATPEIPVEAYDKIRHWRNKLDRTAKLDKRAVFECAAADLFLEAEYERDRGAVRAISDAVYFLGRDHTGLSDDDIQDIMVGAKDKAEWPNGNSLDDFPLLRDAGEPPKPTPEPEPKQLPKLPFINMSNWDNEPVPEQEWAVPDRIPLEQTALFSGEGGYGKSTILEHLCAAHTLGRDWLGSLPEPGPAIFLEAEDGEKPIHRRLAAIARLYGVTFQEMIEGGLHLVSLFGDDTVLAGATRSGKIEPTPRYAQLLQVAGDIKPKMIGIASSANVFAGSENDRTQTQQFVNLLNRVAMIAHGSVVLISHPSLTGINSDSGLSGTTQWHNAVRARFYIKSINPEPGEQPDDDLRELIFKKNQYGRKSAAIVLRYSDGLFLPERSMSGLEKVAQHTKADEAFIDLLKRFADEGRNVSHNANAKTYGPTAFATETEAKKHQLRKADFEAAMRRLFEAKKIRVESYGRPSQPHSRIVLCETHEC
jgi:RecA-family ATPase